MQATLKGSYYEVKVPADEVVKFAASWPGRYLAEADYVFGFSASNGDLVDITIVDADGRHLDSEEMAGDALLALCDDAGRFGAEDLKLEDVLAIRYGEGGITP